MVPIEVLYVNHTAFMPLGKCFGQLLRFKILKSLLFGWKTWKPYSIS